LYIFISAIILIPGIYSLIYWGFKPSIDFSGGTLGEVQLAADLPRDQIDRFASDVGLSAGSITRSSGNSYFIRLPAVDEIKIASFAANIQNTASVSADVIRLETVGPVLGRELLVKAAIAGGLAIIGILLYIAWAFRNIIFGLSAVIALVHDLLVVLGSFSFLGRFFGVEVDTLFVTAFLTTMSFSVHDTIVVFDRIREMSKKGEPVSFQVLCDRALTQTMVRSLVNSFTIIFMLVALILLGGDTIRWFIVALLIGTVSGTYSSPFVATPALMILHNLVENYRRSTK